MRSSLLGDWETEYDVGVEAERVGGVEEKDNLSRIALRVGKGVAGQVQGHGGQA